MTTPCLVNGIERWKDLIQCSVNIIDRWTDQIQCSVNIIDTQVNRPDICSVKIIDRWLYGDCPSFIKGFPTMTLKARLWSCDSSFACCTQGTCYIKYVLVCMYVCMYVFIFVPSNVQCIKNDNLPSAIDRSHQSSRNTRGLTKWDIQELHSSKFIMSLSLYRCFRGLVLNVVVFIVEEYMNIQTETCFQ